MPQVRLVPETRVRLPRLRPGDDDRSKGFTREIFESLANLESRNFWFRSRNKLIAWAMARYFPHAKDVLEIGCGTGFVLSDLEALFPAMRLAGSDVQISGLARAARRESSRRPCFRWMPAVSRSRTNLM